MKKNYILSVVFIVIALVGVNKANAQSYTNKSLVSLSSPRSLSFMKGYKMKHDDIRKNVIKVNLLSMFAATASLAYERVLTKGMTFNLGLTYTGASVSSGGDKVKYSGYGITPELRFYVGGDGGAKGFHVGPFARYRSITVSENVATVDQYGNPTTENAKEKWNQVGGGVVLGYQWLFGNRIAFDLFGGPAFYSNTFTAQGNANTAQFSGVKGGSGSFSFRTGIAFGVAF